MYNENSIKDSVAEKEKMTDIVNNIKTEEGKV